LDRSAAVANYIKMATWFCAFLIYNLRILSLWIKVKIAKKMRDGKGRYVNE